MPERLDELELPLMVPQNTESQRTAFTVAVDFKPGTTTGISAGDRAATIQALIDPATSPHDLARPGHMFPLRYRTGGVLKRAGHTEATIDLARIAGCYPAGMLCEIVTSRQAVDGAATELEAFAETHGLVMITIADLVRYRRHQEKLVERIASARIPTAHGEFTGYAYLSTIDGEQHFALVAGDVAGRQNVLVRVHSECLTGDVFGSRRCDCGPQLDVRPREDRSRRGRRRSSTCAATRVAASGSLTSCAPTPCRRQGRDTVDANLDLGLPVDNREYGIGAQILVDLGITTMRLLTNNPAKYGGLEGFGLDIVERVSIEPAPNPENLRYLQTKRERLGSLPRRPR